MSPLVKESCVSCESGASPLSQLEIRNLLGELHGWSVSMKEGVPRLTKAFAFKDYAQALAFTMKVGEAADQQNHHPALLVEWGRVTVSWWTHRIGGLHRNDFVMAAKTDSLKGQS